MIRIGRIYYEDGRMYIKGADGKLHEFSMQHWRKAGLKKGLERWH